MTSKIQKIKELATETYYVCIVIFVICVAGAMVYQSKDARLVILPALLMVLFASLTTRWSERKSERVKKILVGKWRNVDTNEVIEFSGDGSVALIGSKAVTGEWSMHLGQVKIKLLEVPVVMLRNLGIHRNRLELTDETGQYDRYIRENVDEDDVRPREGFRKSFRAAKEKFSRALAHMLPFVVIAIALCQSFAFNHVIVTAMQIIFILCAGFLIFGGGDSWLDDSE